MSKRYFYKFDELPGNAVELFKQGNLSQCIEICEQAIEEETAVAAAFYLIGGCSVRAGEIELAGKFFSLALNARPEIPNPYFALSILNNYHGDRNLSLSLHKKGLLRADPVLLKKTNVLYDEANFLVSQQEYEEAVELIEEALEMTPFLAPLLRRLGDCYHDLKQFERAEEVYRECLLQNPVFIEPYRNLAVCVDKIHHDPYRAIPILEEALRIWDKYTEARYYLGELFRRLDKPAEAYEHYRFITENDPDYTEAYRRRADSIRDIGGIEEAIEYYNIYKEKNPSRESSVKMDIAFSIPPILDSKEEAEEYHDKLENTLKEYQNDTFSIVDPARDIRGVNFYSAYLGKNERDIQKMTANIFRKSSPLLRYKSKHLDKPRKEGKIRLGIFSCSLKRHSVGRLLYRTILQLPRDVFDITIIFGDQTNDEIVQILKGQFNWINVHKSISEGHMQEAQEDVNALELDILYYPDIGMDVQSYFMAYSRFAPVQIVSWHHPLTTGIDTIDYTISSKKFEVEEAQNHFTEKLILFESTIQNFERIRNYKCQKTRQDFGFSDDDNLYGCPQSSFKIHPDFDDIFKGILEKDPKALILLLEAHKGPWDEALKKRFAKTMPDVMDRIRFLDRTTITGVHDYMNIFDVSLDPPHWSGGVTSLEAFSQGCPVITLPSPYTRARLTYGFYLEMGIEDCIASTPEEYIDIAVKVASDRKIRKDISERILEKCDVLYDNPECAIELAEFFQLAFEAHQKGEKIESFK